MKLTTKFLIRQGSNYHTIKPKFYSNNQYAPLTLEGVTAPTIEDFVEFGFTDLEQLITEESNFSLNMQSEGVEGDGHIHRIEISGYDVISKIEEV